MPNIGDKISFVPHAFMNPSAEFGKRSYPVKVKAEIVYINHEHRWFRARYETCGNVHHECFKF